MIWTWVRVWYGLCPRWVRRRLTRAAWAVLPHATWIGCAGGVWLATPPWPPVPPPGDVVEIPEPSGLMALVLGAGFLWGMRR
jgi:hypothetical protein